MTTRLEALRRRWHALPPAGKFGVSAVGALAIYFGLEDTTWRLAEEWRAEANGLQQLLQRAESIAHSSQAAKQLILIHGDLRPPRDAAAGNQALAEAVTVALARNHITNYSFEARSGAKLPSGSFAGALPSGKRVEQVSAEVSFESSPEDAFRVIANLESDQSVDGVRSLRIDYAENTKRVTVALTVNAWVIAGTRGARRTP